MMREIAEGGARLDRETLGALVSVPRAFFTIVQEGIASRAIRPVHPMVAYVSLLAPIMFYLAAAPIRRQATARHLMNLTALTTEEFVAQLQDAFHRSLVNRARPGRNA
jgi:hypothetical protein